MKSNSEITLKTLIEALQISSEKIEQEKNKQLSLRNGIEVWNGADVCQKLLQILKDASSEEQLNKTLENFLKERWDSGKAPVKGTFLSYTSIPDAEVTNICCWVAEYLYEKNPKRSALSFLIPTLKYTKNLLTHDDITDEPLEQILRSYITSDDYKSLIPTALLSDLSFEMEPEEIFFNPFISEGEKKKPKPLSDNEKSRITHHSFITEEIVSSKETYNKIASKDSSVYSAILVLITGLQRGGAHGLKGGTEAIVGLDASVAVTNFRKYWKLLNDTQKGNARKIVDFKKEIEDTICNEEWIDKCVESQAIPIQTIVSRNRQALTEITLDEDQTSQILKLHEETFIQSKKELQASQYLGRDHLPLSEGQMMHFIHEEQINTPEDVLFILKDLQPKEIELVCSKFKVKIGSVISNPENLIAVILDLNPEQITSFLRSIEEEIAKSSRIVIQLGKVFNILSNEAASVFLEGIQKTINNNLKNASGYVDFLKVLSEEKKNIFYEKAEGKLVEVVTSRAGFSEIWKVLPENKKEGFYEKVEGKLVRIVKGELVYTVTGVYYFSEILKVLPENKKEGFYEKVEGKLVEAVTSNDDFFGILKVLPENKKEGFYEKAEGKLVEAVTSGDDFSKIWEVLPENKKEGFYEKAEGKLVEAVTSSVGFLRIWKVLPENKKEGFYEKAEGKLVEAVTSSAGFLGIWKVLPENKKESFYEKAEGKLVEAVKSGYFFPKIWEVLPENKRYILLEKIGKEKLDQLITMSDDVIAKELRSARMYLVAQQIQYERNRYDLFQQKYDKKYQGTFFRNPLSGRWPKNGKLDMSEVETYAKDHPTSITAVTLKEITEEIKNKFK
jgi:hypothetical protein